MVWKMTTLPTAVWPSKLPRTLSWGWWSMVVRHSVRAGVTGVGVCGRSASATPSVTAGSLNCCSMTMTLLTETFLASWCREFGGHSLTAGSIDRVCSSARRDGVPAFPVFPDATRCSAIAITVEGTGTRRIEVADSLSKLKHTWSDSERGPCCAIWFFV